MTDSGEQRGTAEFTHAQDNDSNRLLQESESRYGLIVAGSEQAFFYQHDVEHRFTYLSPSVRNVIGYEAASLLNRRVDDILWDDPSSTIALGITNDAMRDGQRRPSHTVSVRHKKRHRVVLELIETPVRDNTGAMIMHGLARDVTARKETEERLRLSDEILRAVETMVVVANARGEIIYVNPYTTALLGYPAHELLGLGWWRLTFESVKIGRAAMERLAACARGERELSKGKAELMTASDGSKRWILWHDTRAESDLIIGSGQDITDRKLAEEALTHRTTYLNELIANSPLGIVAIDNGGLVQMFNPAFEHLFQYSQSELLGRSLVDAIAPLELRDEVIDLTNRILTGKAIHVVAERRCKDGSSRTVDIHGVPLRVEGRVIGGYGLYRDITEQVLAEKSLRKNEHLLDLFFSQSIAGAFFMMLDKPVLWDGREETFEYIWVHTRCTKTNQALAQQYGTTPDAMFGITPQDVQQRAPSCDRKTWRELLDVGSIEIEFEDRRFDGNPIWIEGHYSCIYDSEGRLTGFFGMQRDMTSRRQAEEARAASEQQLRAIFTNSIDGMLLFNDVGEYLDANPAACEILGVPREQILGRKVGTFVVDPSSGATMLHEFAEKRAAFGFADVVRPDGSIRNTEYTATANILPGLHVTMVRDITTRRKLEDQLLQAQKMEAIGNLAGGIAHDFNNMLTVIRGYSELLLSRFRQADPSRRYATGILNAADRAALTTQQLLAFSRRQVVQPQHVNLNQVVNDMEGLIRRLIGEDIEIRTALAQDLGAVVADPGQIGQIILNLAVNSRDAMPGGGILTIETSNVVLDEFYAAVHPSTKPGPYVMLAVTDTGCGIDAATRPHIFEPFFTTKSPGKGTGLGLATVYGIVNQGRGAIYVYSEVGEGTTFKVYLPRVDFTATRRTQSEENTQADNTANNGTTICVIEDEDAARDLIGEYLRKKGYNVIPVRDGEEALRVLQQSDEHIDLLLSDVMLGGVNGQDLAGHLTLRHPEALTLYMSGFTKEVLVERGVLDASSEFIAKPFAMAELLERIAEVLRSRPRSECVMTGPDRLQRFPIPRQELLH